jgi:uncharacterized protein (DUF849 family)
MDVALYREVVERIRQSGSELLVNLITASAAASYRARTTPTWPARAPT